VGGAGITIPGIDAEDIVVGTRVMIAPSARIRSRAVRLGDDVVIGEGVRIASDELIVGNEARIGARSTILSPRILIGDRSVIGTGLEAELNEYFTLGRLCDIGRSVRLVGQGLCAGDHLWLTDAVIVGGGGARGPRSKLTIGDRSAIMDRCFINLSDEVSIGSDTALSNGVTVLTHSLWQPVLEGGTSSFAPVRIGDRSILYVNAVIAPGVTIGNDVTIGAAALVLQDVPDASTAVGNPARHMKSTPAVPRELPVERQEALVREMLREWASTLAIKGVSAAYDDERDAVVAETGAVRETVRFISTTKRADTEGAATITLGFGPASAAEGCCHFDLSARSLSGDPSPVAEDLRDYLRRRTLRIYSDRPFRALPPANLARLRALLTNAE
jgi:acetyltransferase-like isoleucine patch superfamily enzyme